jgi:hypothetical protein
MYVLPMTDLQREFYNALFAPFHDYELSEVAGRGTKTLTYIDKRALENRLDTVCGPAGWRPEYRFGMGSVSAPCRSWSLDLRRGPAVPLNWTARVLRKQSTLGPV